MHNVENAMYNPDLKNANEEFNIKCCLEKYLHWWALYLGWNIDPLAVRAICKHHNRMLKFFDMQVNYIPLNAKTNFQQKWTKQPRNAIGGDSVKNIVVSSVIQHKAGILIEIFWNLWNSRDKYIYITYTDPASHTHPHTHTQIYMRIGVAVAVASGKH